MGIISEELKKMSFGEHFDELRRRLMVCVGSIVVLFIVCFIFKEPLKNLVLDPYESLRLASLDGEHPLKKLVFISPTEKFVFYLKVCLLFSILVAGPIILYQMWQFIGAGLYLKEQRPIKRIMPISLVLFAVGMVFGYSVLFPIGLEFLITFGDQDKLDASIAVSRYFSLFSLLILVMGFVFQTPLVMVVTTKIGITTPKFFSSKRKYFILGAFIVSALLTPPDWATQCLLAGPLIVLFEIGIVLCRFLVKGKRDVEGKDDRKRGKKTGKEKPPSTSPEEKAESPSPEEETESPRAG